ncbi:hypothetical protein EIP91_001637 [Steccherinum ochraceum]|uniref:Uncharacterized protein n=1 Tax=Steccherinum ochraceum TaxID=92696 RepID=A0A4R0RUA6_9APHY|nr:hypothetical protein EIP91_001637 [Steccherinum ochraceum]
MDAPTPAFKDIETPLSFRLIRSFPPKKVLSYELPFHGSLPSPLATPPVDLLIEILMCIQADVIHHEHSAAPWLRYTHVSKYWRTTALQCPLLWRYIGGCPPTDTEYIEEMIKRSREAPVRCVLQKRHPGRRQNQSGSAEAMVALVLPILHRVETLSLSFDECTRTARIEDAPLLRTLELSCERSTFGQGARADELLIQFPLCVSGAPLPSLEVLKIHGTEDCLASTSICEFMRPTLKALDTWLCKEVTVVDLLYALQETPMLETFKLSSCCLEEDWMSKLPTVSLPWLRVFSLVDIPAECAAQLLTHVNLPADVRIVMEECHASSSPSEMPLIDAMAARLAGKGILGSHKPVTYIALDWHHDMDESPLVYAHTSYIPWNSTVDGWNTFTLEQIRGTETGPFCSYVIYDLPYSFPNVTPAFQATCRRVSSCLEEVRVLSISANLFLYGPFRDDPTANSPDLRFWSHWCRYMTQVETLHLKGFLWKGLGVLSSVDELLLGPSSATGDFHAELPFPHLRCLHLESVRFRRPKVQRALNGDVHVEDLLAVVRTRDEAGLRLSRLEFTKPGPGLELEDRRRLAEYVDQVELWDCNKTKSSHITYVPPRKDVR